MSEMKRATFEKEIQACVESSLVISLSESKRCVGRTHWSVVEAEAAAAKTETLHCCRYISLRYGLKGHLKSVKFL